MRKLKLLALFYVLFISLSIKQTQANISGKLASKGIKLLTQKNIVHETGINFNDFHLKLKNESDWIILFFANWCSFSKRFSKQVYVRMKNITKQLNFSVIPAAVQCPSNRKICNKLKITAYPRIFYFPAKGGKYKFPSIPRTQKNVIQFMKKSHERIHVHIQQKIQQVENVEDATQIQQSPVTPQDLNQEEEEQEIQQQKTEPTKPVEQQEKSNIKQQKQIAQQQQVPKLEPTHLKQKVLISLLVLLVVFIFSALFVSIAEKIKKRRSSKKMIEAKDVGQNVYVANNSQIQSAQSQRNQMYDSNNEQISKQTKVQIQ